jgi:hypothetical protein
MIRGDRRKMSGKERAVVFGDCRQEPVADDLGAGLPEIPAVRIVDENMRPVR